MKFLIDESADARLASYLSSQGHDAIFVAQSHGPGLSDERIFAIAHEEGRILITDDRDFGELVFRFRQPHSGVIYFRLRDTLWATKLSRLTFVLEHHERDLDEFLVVTESRVRSGAPPWR
jgi:predicted nuclease of predicted toxin-antitoxin system